MSDWHDNFKGAILKVCKGSLLITEKNLRNDISLSLSFTIETSLRSGKCYLNIARGDRFLDENSCDFGSRISEFSESNQKTGSPLTTALYCSNCMRLKKKNFNLVYVVRVKINVVYLIWMKELS